MPTDYDIADAMMAMGGGFVKRLGELWHHADDDNKWRLKNAFPEYWRDYTAKAEMLNARRANKEKV